MSETNDFSKRFFADFIAARLKARRIEEDQLRQARQDPGPEASPRAEADPVRVPNHSHHPA